ncbi:MAG: hypothetical protein QOG62_2509 [Thermoleophilaceae bacterium]|nr:hypothetical protein [Thermoleophilaceae bacterium]
MLQAIANYVRRHHVGLIAVFIALGGSAYAATSNKITSSDIASNAVKGKHVKDGALTGADVADDSLSGADVSESTLDLPKPPDSLLVGGPEDQFVDLFGDTPTGRTADTGTGAECTMGQAELWPDALWPPGRTPARGQLLPLNQNTALFALFGFTYGGSDAIHQFALPDMRAITPDHMVWTICLSGVFP